MKKVVLYKKNNDCYYKINYDLRRITKIQNNEVSYLEYNTYIGEVQSYKSIKMNTWKQVENSFFISRDFEWEYGGKKYKTTDKPIQWSRDKNNLNSTLVFHNGKIWIASNAVGHYYPRVFLETEKYVTPTREVLVEKDLTKTYKFIKRKSEIEKTSKWTDIKYCRNFEKIN